MSPRENRSEKIPPGRYDDDDDVSIVYLQYMIDTL